MDQNKFGFELLHVGLNQSGAEEGTATAMRMAELFGFPLRETDGSWFANEQFEIMKKPFRGTHGHFAIGTNDAGTARAWLESKGIRFDESTAQYGEDGKLKLIYSSDEIGGFAFHLTQKSEQEMI
ncbi:MAG: VOC family protein [Lawsonibacter sp.]